MKKIWNSFEVYVGTVCSIAMISILFANVVGRFIIRKSIPWAEEVCLILFIQSVFWGAVGAVRTRQHLRIEFLISNFKPKAKMIVDIIGNILFIAFNFIILFGLMPLVLQLYNNGTAYAVTGLPKYLSYIWLPVTFLLMSVRLVQDCFQRVKDYKDDPTGEKKAAREEAAMRGMMVEDADQAPGKEGA